VEGESGDIGTFARSTVFGVLEVSPLSRALPWDSGI